VDRLKKHGFDARLVDETDHARKLVLEMTSAYQTIGFGGSATIRSLGITDELKAGGKTLYDHLAPGLSSEESLNVRKKQQLCDCFLCSANAVAATGEIINIDGIGNRVAAMTFGPSKAIIVAGINKVRPDVDSALKRLREIAGPMRAKSLDVDTPCAKTGVCEDCNSVARICNATVILHRRPLLTDISVIIVNQALGY